MINFAKIFESIGNNADRKANRIFKEGKEYGYELGLKDNMLFAIKESSELSESELKELRDFLIKRNLILSYDLSIGGFRVRKYNYNQILNQNK